MLLMYNMTPTFRHSFLFHVEYHSNSCPATKILDLPLTHTSTFQDNLPYSLLFPAHQFTIAASSAWNDLPLLIVKPDPKFSVSISNLPLLSNVADQKYHHICLSQHFNYICTFFYDLSYLFWSNRFLLPHSRHWEFPASLETF